MARLEYPVAGVSRAVLIERRCDVGAEEDMLHTVWEYGLVLLEYRGC